MARQTVTARVSVLERAAFGYTDVNGNPHPGFITRVCRLETLARILVALVAIPALKNLGVPTEQLSVFAKDLVAMLMHV